MNTTPKMVVLAALCLLAKPAAHAQESADSNPEKLQQQWFAADTVRANYQFTAQLSKGERLELRFRKLSDWTGPEDFQAAFTAGKQVLDVYKDSLEQEQQTRVLDVYLPANRKNIISRFRQTDESAGMMTINSDGATALKLGLDTLRIRQQKSGMARIQYTFLLKSLSNYNVYANDELWQQKTAAKIDSVVNEYRSKWKKNPDADRHGFTATYNPEMNTTRIGLAGRERHDALLIEGGVGISLVRNMLCPNVEAGAGIYLNRSSEQSSFLRVSASAFYRFQESTPNKYKAYKTAFLNVELGSESNHSNPKAFFYKTSLGFGYKLISKHEEDRDPTMDKKMYRLFFTYAINKFFVLTPEFVSNFKKGDNRNQWFGLSLNVKIL